MNSAPLWFFHWNEWDFVAVMEIFFYYCQTCAILFNCCINLLCCVENVLQRKFFIVIVIAYKC